MAITQSGDSVEQFSCLICELRRKSVRHAVLILPIKM